MSLAGCQIISIDLNFHLQKCLEIFDKKNSADKIQSKNYKGGKSTLPHANYGWWKLNTLKLQNVKEGCSVI